VGDGKARGLLAVLDGIVAVTAIGGGLALAAGLESERFPLAWLRGTPFHTYTAPGLMLAMGVGGSAAVATALTLSDARTGARASVVAGSTLAGWIAGEVLLLRDDEALVSPTEAVFLLLATAMVALGARGIPVGDRDRRSSDAAHPGGGGPA
jgi:hypothetical protein